MGILIAFKEKSPTTVKKNWSIKVIFIGIVTIIMCINTKIFIAQTVVDKTITTKTSFQNKYEIYENCNKLLPYNSEYKIKIIKLIEAYEFKYPDKKIEFSKKILEYAKYLVKYEKYYNQSEIQSKLVLNSIELIGIEENSEMIKNIKDGYELIKNNKLKKHSYINYTIMRRSQINKIAENLIKESSIIDDEKLKIELKKLAKQFYLLNRDEYEENKKYIENYADDTYIEKEKLLNLLLNYKEEAIKKIEEM